MISGRAETDAFFNQAAVTHHQRELPHDDFGRMHYDFPGFYYDFRMTSETLVSETLVPAIMSMRSAFGNKTSGRSEDGDNAG